ncbi:MAG TPA: dihydrodipicolinate synthase family protein [Stellaceae bacterium]|nr:dihydrodipicolinate synthase family protein [Stellaceae bacterium]
MSVSWRGVFPAITTQFRPDGALDLNSTQRGVEEQIRAGVHGLIVLGTVGENCSLEPQEKRQILAATKEVVARKVPVLSGVAEYTTAQAAAFARDCEKIGIDGLMVLPGMVYKADEREALAHFRAVAAASGLPIMIYNNPPAYNVDVTPEGFKELASERRVVAIKESSENLRRLTDIVNLTGDRYTLFCGVDDLVLESMLLGAVGWVSGLVNVFPKESVRLWELAVKGDWERARAIYRWFMPTLHLDTSPKLVQMIKLGQKIVGNGSAVTRAPRLALEGEELKRVTRLYEEAIASRPTL